MKPQEVQSLVLRTPAGPAVAHLILTVPEGLGRAAACLLDKLHPSFGTLPASSCLSIGFSFSGLVAMGLPDGYLRVFRSAAPAFAAGAVRRSVRLGDHGASAAQRWHPAFQQDTAHVLLTWHGPETAVHEAANRLADTWHAYFKGRRPEPLFGARLGAPVDQRGEWVHFGYRDGISEICIDKTDPPPDAEDLRQRAPGALLLCEVNDAGYASFVLPRLAEKIRAFFRDSSFGILRPMAQDVAAFEAAVDRGQRQLAQVLGAEATRDLVKAKLCGRWPDGRLLRPGELSPQNPSLRLDLETDPAGEGCPFGSHVRRMRAAPDGDGYVLDRPLQRRSFPFGPAAWNGPDDGEPPQRGHLSQFFCASIEDQFEHLMGQWAAQALPSATDQALDPLMGPHDDPEAGLDVPFKGHKTQSLRGFGAWTTTLGTMYAWHPGASGLRALLNDDFVPDENEVPWL